MTSATVGSAILSLGPYGPSTGSALIGGLLPGVTLSTGPNDFQPIEQLQLMQFKGERWQLFGDVISGEIGGN